jgi:hypothetical protein
VKVPALAVVIATIRPESFRRWADAWAPLLGDTAVYVIEDQPEKTDLGGLLPHWHHYSWQEIDAELGRNNWVIPRRSSAIKSFGFLEAYAAGADYIWTLDDDCLPEPDSPLGRPYPYLAALRHHLLDEYPADSWWNTLSPLELYPRGYPYGIRQETQPVMIHHGLWSGVPDLDGVTALEHHKLRLDPCTSVERVPTGQMFPMCGMNLAFRAEMAPAMYFGLQGRQRNTVHNSVLEGTRPLPFDRFDDIWAGLLAKKICDHLGYAVTSGAPSVLHTKESDPAQRVIKEGPGIAAHELLWPEIAGTHVLHGVTTVKECYSELSYVVAAAAPRLPYPDYWRKLADAMHLWTELF